MSGNLWHKFIENQIENLNLHLPKKRISLHAAIENEIKKYIAKDGTELVIDPKEIALLKEICPKSKLEAVFLPIIIIRRRDLGQGVFTVAGEIIEEYLIAKVIGLYEKEWDEYLKERKKDLYLYKPHIIEIRKKLRTATVIGFA